MEGIDQLFVVHFQTPFPKEGEMQEKN